MPTPQTKSKTRKTTKPAPPVYIGKRTRTGNSLGFRFEQALFKSHPEFSGEVRGHVIAPGRLLVTAEPAADPIDELSEDPVLSAFLAFLHKDMLDHPENIRPMSEARLRRVKSLTKGIIVDENEDLGEENLLG